MSYESGMSADAFVNFLKDLGYRASDPNMSEDIAAIDTGLGGYKCRVFLLNPDPVSKMYSTGQLYAGFASEVTIEGVNQWNVRKRFVKAHMRDKKLVLQMDFFLFGASSETLERIVRLFDNILRDVADHPWSGVSS